MAKSAPSQVDLGALASLPIGLLSSFITPAVMELVRARLDLTDEKLALMLVKLINPSEHLTNAEEGVIRGMDRKTVGKTKAAREI